MVDSAILVIRELMVEFGPQYEKKINYCEHPSPYITEEHCPPKRAPEIPRRRGDF